MRDFLVEMFEINAVANLEMLSNIEILPSPDDGLKYLSHLANCQYKWLDRLKVFPQPSLLDWWNPIYSADELRKHIIESSQHWVQYLSVANDEEIEIEMNYIGYDGNIWQSKLRDIAMQLIFHSYHHRAQMQMMIRTQGHRPAFIDYIGFKSKKTGTT